MEKFLNSILMENSQVVEQPIHLPTLMDKLTNHTVAFIESKRGQSKPFAIYHSFTSVHTPLTPSKAFRGRSQHGKYGDR
jgi:hypothetical protein